VHASQQLGRCPTQACPPFGALHRVALALMLHFVTSLAVVRQQVTNPRLPQVDRAAHDFTALLQDLGSPLSTAFATRTAQRT